MKRYRFVANKVLVLASLIAGLSLTGCGMAQGSLHAINVAANSSAPVIVTSSTIPADKTAPEIEALDVTIPYGSFLRLADIATITDDQDKSPVLEIVSVVDMNDKAGQNTVSSGEGVTLPATETAAMASATPHENASTTSVTAREAVKVKSDEKLDNKEASADSTEIAAAAVTSETAAEAEPAEPGYLFSTPGKYSMLLKGTDKSGNESTKTITVTVVDETAPVYDGLRESFEITDKDKNAPDYLEGIKATDEIDGDVTTTIKADDSKVQYGKAGAYSVAYSVADKSGNKAIAATPVIIKDTTAPYLAVITSAFNLFVTDEKPNYASLVTAIDAVDGDVKDSLIVDDSSVEYKYPGEYNAKFSVQDKSGNATEKTVTVKISAGWKTQDGKTFYYSPDDGHLNHNWSYIDGKWYYFDPDDGHMLTGMLTSGDNQYLLDSKDGHMITGWQLIDGKYYYYSPDDGHMYHGWGNVNGKEYFFDRSEGYMLTGAQTIDGRQYLLDSVNGDMITGWQLIDGKYYYYSPDDGHMYHDWSNIDGTEYYFDKSDGHMYTGTHYIDGVQYDFGTSGAAREVVQQRSSSNSGSRSYYDYAYIGNRKTKKLHKSSCSSVRDMNEGNKVGFDSRSEAINAGYTPCQRCHP